MAFGLQLRRPDHKLLVHSRGVVLDVLGPASTSDAVNILMDVEVKYPGYTHIALTVASLDAAKQFVSAQGIEITGSFGFKNMSATCIRDPDRNVIELDAYGATEIDSSNGYTAHP